jgi:ATP-dependent protease ClpP protease subunit/uncharacterized protein YukE
MIYCLDPNVEKPIMLLDQQIGYDPDDPSPYVDGSAFARELMELDAMGKSEVCIWVASPGGSVADGMKIYSAMLKTRCKVNTYCVLAASIAAPIFLAGRNRTMADFGKLMFHNPSGGDDKALSAIKDTIITMVQSRSKMSYKDIGAMMNRTTWISADEAFALGLCDEIESSGAMNIPRPKMIGEPVAMWKEASLFVNNALKTPINKMKNIATALGLAEDATEEQITAAIGEMKNTAKTAADASKTAADVVASLKATVDSLKEEISGIKNSNATAEADAKKAKAETLITKYTNRLGKISDEVKASWINKAVANYEDTEKLLEALPVNAQSVNVSMVANKLGDGELPTTAVSLAAQVTNRLKKEGRNVPTTL